MIRLSALTILLALFTEQVLSDEQFSTKLQLQDAINMALSANHGFLNLADQAQIAELDYTSARSVYKTKFASAMSSDARSGADVGSTYNIYLHKMNPSGTRYNAGYYNSSFGDRNLSELRFSYTLPLFKNPLDNNELAIDQAEINLARSKRIIEIGREELINEVISRHYRLSLSIQSNELAASRLDIAQNV